MDVDTLLVSLSHLPPSIRVHVNKIVLFANAVDGAVAVLESKSSRHSSSLNLRNDSGDSTTDSGSSKSLSPRSSSSPLNKACLSLRRLYLCFQDLFDMLESCSETIDLTKKKSIYFQIDPSIALIRNSVDDIQKNYSSILEAEGIHFSFGEVDSGLNDFLVAVKNEREQLADVRPVAQHPNLIVIMTSGLSYSDIEDSIARYIPRNDLFPCSEKPLPIPAFAESDLSGSYVRPPSPGILDWEEDEEFGMDVDPDSPLGVSPTESSPLIHRSSSPSIGGSVQFPNIAHFARTGTVLSHHYTAAGGECPGRATLLTGQLPPVHGVRTSLEKTGSRSELKRDEIPTLGHYLASGGYDVVYKGEWGLSEVQALQEHPILDLLGVERQADEDLQPFGFQGWEAHRETDWYKRSLQTTSEAVEYVRRRECVMSSESLRGSQPPPYALVVSYGDVMPDMMNLAEEEEQQLVEVNEFEFPSMPCTSFSCGNLREMEMQRRAQASQEAVESKYSKEEWETLPHVQRQYAHHCGQVNPNRLEEAYRQNSKRLDDLIGELLQEVLRGGSMNTVILFTSVTGNLVGKHGLWGSCYNGYEGSIHTPCIFFVPPRLPFAQRLQPSVGTRMTSSLDLLPTLLHLTGIDRKEVEQQLRVTHKSIPKLPGQDLCVQGTQKDFIYYQSEDVAMPLPHTASYSTLPTTPNMSEPPPVSMVQQRSVAVLVALQDAEYIKLCLYSSDPRNCAHLTEDSYCDRQMEWQLFNMTRDPNERHDLAHEKDSEMLLRKMQMLLAEKYEALCAVSQTCNREEDIKTFSILSMSATSSEVKWRQFYILVIALIISFVAILTQYLLSKSYNCLLQILYCTF